MLQGVARCCGVLQGVVRCCGVLRGVVRCCEVLQGVARHVIIIIKKAVSPPDLDWNSQSTRLCLNSGHNSVWTSPPAAADSD